MISEGFIQPLSDFLLVLFAGILQELDEEQTKQTKNDKKCNREFTVKRT